jgi:hypothetical protein
MTDYIYLSTTSVVIIVVGVALLAMLVTLALDTFGEPERSHKVVLFVCLTVIWAMAVLVVTFIRLPI